MSPRRRYRRREKTLVTAVQLAFDTAGFSYRKWGHEQYCKPGDWLVDRDGELYTVDGAVFAKTYAERSPGRYEKVALVWAERAESAGSIRTHEGSTDYEKGDYLVFNEPDAGAEASRDSDLASDLDSDLNPPNPDGWAMSAERFRSLYDCAE